MWCVCRWRTSWRISCLTCNRQTARRSCWAGYASAPAHTLKSMCSTSRPAGLTAWLSTASYTTSGEEEHARVVGGWDRWKEVETGARCVIMLITFLQLWSAVCCIHAFVSRTLSLNCVVCVFHLLPAMLWYYPCQMKLLLKVDTRYLTRECKSYSTQCGISKCCQEPGPSICV